MLLRKLLPPVLLLLNLLKSNFIYTFFTVIGCPYRDFDRNYAETFGVEDFKIKIITAVFCN